MQKFRCVSIYVKKIFLWRSSLMADSQVYWQSLEADQYGGDDVCSNKASLLHFELILHRKGPLGIDPLTEFILCALFMARRTSSWHIVDAIVMRLHGCYWIFFIVVELLLVAGRGYVTSILWIIDTGDPWQYLQNRTLHLFAFCDGRQVMKIKLSCINWSHHFRLYEPEIHWKSNFLLSLLTSPADKSLTAVAKFLKALLSF